MGESRSALFFLEGEGPTWLAAVVSLFPLSLLHLPHDTHRHFYCVDDLAYMCVESYVCICFYFVPFFSFVT